MLNLVGRGCKLDAWYRQILLPTSLFFRTGSWKGKPAQNFFRSHVDTMMLEANKVRTKKRQYTQISSLSGNK